MFSYRLKRVFVLLVLLLWLPVYVVLVLNLLAYFERPNLIIELLVYAVVGVFWAWPFKSLFKGIGQSNKKNK
ncbi:DUF2842 domain-containing protein [Paracoccaceae bacterium]|nr:DUF2842 domain-containing protein [Paracoccaceae bacterium]